MGREISIEDVLTGLDDLGIVLDSEGKTVLHVPAFYLPRKKLTLKDISAVLLSLGYKYTFQYEVEVSMKA